MSERAEVQAELDERKAKLADLRAQKVEVVSLSRQWEAVERARGEIARLERLLAETGAITIAGPLEPRPRP